MLRLVALDKLPYRVDGDAAQMSIDAINAWKLHIPVFATGWFSNNNLDYYIQGIFLLALDKGLWGQRVFSALGGVLSVLATYLLGKELFNKNIGLLAGVFICFMPMHLAFSRLGTDVIYSGFFVAIVMFFVLLSIKKNYKYSIFAGIFLGFAQYFYHTVRFIPVLTVITYISFLFNKEYRRNIIKSLPICIFIGLLLYSPMLYFFYFHHEEFYAKVGQVTVFSNGWLTSELKLRPIWTIFIDQLSKSFTVYYQNVNTASIHLFLNRFISPLDGILFFLGVIWLFINRKRTELSILLIWFLLGTILSAAIMISTPQASRYVIHLPVICIFIAVGFYRVALLLNIKYRQLFIAAFLTIYILISFYSYYQYEMKEIYHYDINTQIATYAGRYLASDNTNKTIYFLGNHYMHYYAIPSLIFLTGRDGIDVYDTINNPVFTPYSMVIILSSRENEIANIRRLYPYAVIKEMRNPLGDLLFYFCDI